MMTKKTLGGRQGCNQERINRVSKEINFNPYTANVLDYVGKRLQSTTTGEIVEICQDMRGQFAIYVASAPIETELGNLAASSVLNRIGCRLA